MSGTDLATLLCGVAIVVGIIGTIVPVLPGPIVIAVAVLIWAIVVQSTAGWVALVVVLLLLGIGEVVKYLTAGKRLTASGVPTSSLVVAGLVGVVGFFVIPVLGLPIGFVGGLTLVEYTRHREWDATWSATKAALAAVGLIMLIEIAAALLASAAWGIAVWQGAAG